MPVVTAGLGTFTLAGFGATVAASPEADLSDAVAFTGLPATALTAEDTDPTPVATPNAVRARVLDANGTFLRHITKPQGLHWTDEFNTAGSGSADLLRSLEQLDASNQVMIAVGETDIFRLIFDSEPSYQVDDTGNRVDAWSGAGAMGVLNSGMIEPEYGWRPEATDERSFDYGSNPAIGGWLVASEWRAPVGRRVRRSWRWTFKKRHLPKGWPDQYARWLWWKDPDTTSVPDEICYFRSSFTLGATSRVKFWVCGDDTLEFQVDGEIRATAGPGGWKKPTTVVLTLSPGDHYVAAKVQNATASDGSSNRSGFLCSIAKMDGDGKVKRWLRRTDTTNWVMRRQRSGPPGWFPAQILRQLVQEQKDRGCAGHSPVTFGFDTVVDSAGRAWVGRQDLGLQIETLGLDYVQRLVEAGIDVAMSPSMKLNAWHSRGVDRSKVVFLDQGDRHALAETGAQPPAIRNVAYARARTGFVGIQSSTSVATRGRRETGVTLGSSRSTVQTARALTGMLPDMAVPPQTIEVKISGATGKWQPYTHFNVADWVSTRPTGATAWVRCRVMSIGGEVNPAGHADWTLQLYED